MKLWRSNKKPLVVFVHVPKAGGHTVNHFLRSHCGKGLDQCQNLLPNLKSWNKAANRHDWISGHLAWNKFNHALTTSTARSLRYFSTVRNPIDQVCSHYNWLIEINYRGRAFYEGHGENLKEVSRQIRSADNQNPYEIITILERHSGLFLNLQSRFVLGDDIDLSSDAFTFRLNQYEHVASLPKLSKLYYCLNATASPGYQKENVGRYHINRSIFETKIIKEFLAERNQYDEMLYKLVLDS